MGLQVNLARECSNAQLLHDVQQVHLSVQFVLGLLEEHTFELLLFITTCTAAAKKILANILGAENEVRPLFQVFNQELPS
jgi:hypothetical protein